MPESEISVVIRMPESLHAAVKGKAAVMERSMAWVMREALRRYVKGTR